MIKQLIKNSSIMSKVMSSYEAALMIKDGMTVATSGFTPSGYPKAVPQALADIVESTGKKIKLTLFTGASVGEEIDGRWTQAGIICKRMPYQTNNLLRNSINRGECEFSDIHLSNFAQNIRYGFYGEIDIAIIEAVGITEEGFIIPSTSVGASPVYVQKARKVIVEINTSLSKQLEGFADVYMPDDPPHRLPIPLFSAQQRIGTKYIPCNKEKIAAVVISEIQDKHTVFSECDDTALKISNHLLNFLHNEIIMNRVPKTLLPLQSGVGNIANAVLSGIEKSNFSNISFYTEVIQDSMLKLIKKGKAVFASGTALTLSTDCFKEFENNISFFKERVVLRPQEISNSPEIIRRLGVIAINTAIEADIYGNINSTNLFGTRMMNGIGGSGDFARNAYLSIFTMPSAAKNGDISSIVPMVSHHDHTEHDVMIVITENGVADLRGLSPKQRAMAIINNCSHPYYRPMLKDYFLRSQKSGSLHTPHRLEEALSWHVRFLRYGTMKTNAADSVVVG